MIRLYNKRVRKSIQNKKMKTTETSISTEYLKAEKDLVKAVKEMTEQIQTLRDLEPLQILKRPWRLLWFSFIKGLMIGFGSVLGATVLITLLVYLLAKLSDVPVLGSFLDKILIKTETIQQDAVKGGILLDKYQESKKSLENNK